MQIGDRYNRNAECANGHRCVPVLARWIFRSAEGVQREVNIYDQLHEIRDELERRGAAPATLDVLDRLITQAEPERDNPLSISQSMMLRHLLRQRDVLNNHYVEMDLLALAGDLDEQRPVRRDEDLPDATADSETHQQHTHNYYKKQKEKEKERQRRP
jgi:hypothetical protein